MMRSERGLSLLPLRPLRWGFGASCLALLLLSSAAHAQQIFINSTWVTPSSDSCTGPNPDGQYFCKGPPDADCPETPKRNISNNPRLEFDSSVFSGCSTSPSIPPGSLNNNVCNSKLFICVNIGYSNKQSGNTAFSLDSVSFEVFKFGAGSNPLDPQSTPPLRTFFIDNPGTVPASEASSDPGVGPIPKKATCNFVGLPTCGYCALWDGSINILGEQGKSNGTYGFRAKVETNQTGVSGNINISQVRSFPGGATLNSACNSAGTVEQKPITLDVVNVHAVRSSATIVGSLTGVSAEPYNITYRLSKDATMYITISNPSDSLVSPVVRRLVDGLPRVGEGTPDGGLQNGDAWNGRADNGALMPPGVYLATLQAFANDQFGFDLSAPTTRQISLDPLQITDILVQPLSNQSTSLAVLSYVLTEPATAYIDIYAPGTQFCSGLNSVNNPAVIPDQTEGPTVPPKDFAPRLGGCGGGTVVPVRRFVEQKDFRRPVVSFWDGRDANGNIVPDGDYVFVAYAALPSQNGFSHCSAGCASAGNPVDKRIWTSTAKSGFITVARGFVGVSQITPSSTIIGSSPSVAGLNPFVFSYSLSRDAIVTLRVLEPTGRVVKRTLVDHEVRPGNFQNRELWADAVGDDGLLISSGTYLVELQAADPFQPSRVSTTTVMFPLDLFRITDVVATPLLTGSTDVVTITYQLSQAMNLSWNLYPPGTVITGFQASWPPCGALTPSFCAQTLNNGVATKPIVTFSGMRPGRLRITEFWDGRDSNGLFVPDGTYVYTLVALSTTTPRFIPTDRVFGTISVSRGSIVFPVFNIKPTVPTLFNSSQTVTLPPFEVDYSLTRQSSVTIRIMDTRIPPRVARTLVAGQVRDAGIINQDFWDGRDDRGNFVSPGFYTVQAVAEDLASVLSSGSTVQQTVAVNPLRVYDVAVSPLLKDASSALISYQVSETMKVSVKIYRPATSFDVNGNPNPPENISLVRRIVGVRPARQEITEVWDGRDEKLSIVQDGNYIFKILASTDIAAVDTITGNLTAGASLAEDLIVAEVPVVRGESANPQEDFEANTFMYPNPVSGPAATFNIFVPFQADVFLKIYNVAGDLVYEKSPDIDKKFKNVPKSTDNGPIVFNWAKVNASNRRVAPGVYFVLVRVVETLGGANVLQTVKKMLVH